jgi:hypothetical protein
MGDRKTQQEAHDREEQRRRNEELRRFNKENATKRALADLTAGIAKQYRTSGIVGPSYRYHWDPETGLRIEDTGCMGSAENDEYNRVVKKWIAEHGIPPGSMKPRFATDETVQAALLTAKPLQAGEEITTPKGGVLRRIVHGSHHLLFVSSAGRPTWSHWFPGANERIDVAWSGQDSLFVRLTSNDAPDRAFVWHVDADDKGVLQAFLLPRPSSPASTP